MTSRSGLAGDGIRASPNIISERVPVFSGLELGFRVEDHHQYLSVDQPALIPDADLIALAQSLGLLSSRSQAAPSPALTVTASPRNARSPVDDGSEWQTYSGSIDSNSLSVHLRGEFDQIAWENNRGRSPPVHVGAHAELDFNLTEVTNLSDTADHPWLAGVIDHPLGSNDWIQQTGYGAIEGQPGLHFAEGTHAETGTLSLHSRQAHEAFVPNGYHAMTDALSMSSQPLHLPLYEPNGSTVLWTEQEQGATSDMGGSRSDLIHIPPSTAGVPSTISRGRDSQPANNVWTSSVLPQRNVRSQWMTNGVMATSHTIGTPTSESVSAVVHTPPSQIFSPPSTTMLLNAVAQARSWTDREIVDTFLKRTQAKKWRCMVCGKELSDRKGAIRHFRNKHLEEEPYGCMRCRRRFKRNDNCSRHVASCGRRPRGRRSPHTFLNRAR